MRGCRNLCRLSFDCCHWGDCITSDSWKDTNLPVFPVEVIQRGTQGVFEAVKAVLHRELFVFSRKLIPIDSKRISLNGFKLSEDHLLLFLETFKEGNSPCCRS
jgi:hypothetical protein